MRKRGREVFEDYVLDAYLGGFEFDRDAIVNEATEIVDGVRVWKEDIDLNEICERNDISK